MSINDDIVKAKKRLRELRKRQARAKGDNSFAFFKDNGIEHLLEDVKEMKKFIKEIELVLEKYGKTEEEKKEVENESDED